MPLTDYDHIQALRNRLNAKIREKESELRELQELMTTLDRAPKILKGEIKLGVEFESAGEKKERRPYNKNILPLILDYLRNHQEKDTSIDIGKLDEYLRDNGIEGKHRKQYIRVALQRESKKADSGVVFIKGRGYVKTSPQIANEVRQVG